MGRLQAALTGRCVGVGRRASLADILPWSSAPRRHRGRSARPTAGRHAALDDAGLVGRIKGALAVEPAWNVRLMLAFGSKAAINAASPQIPALSNGAAFRVDAHIKAGELPDAFTTALASLTSRKKVDPAKFAAITLRRGRCGRRRHHVPGLRRGREDRQVHPRPAASRGTQPSRRCSTRSSTAPIPGSGSTARGCTTWAPG